LEDEAYIRRYLEEIDQLPVLTSDEELACVAHIRAGEPLAEAARQRLIEAHLHLVLPIVKRHETEQIAAGDLIFLGNQALLAALPSFIDSAEPSFAAHAAPAIERAITDALAAGDFTGISWTCYWPEAPSERSI
jgi:DNA-directed RNA polymerase sigma subunit (sigma70/sigma32)